MIIRSNPRLLFPAAAIALLLVAAALMTGSVRRTGEPEARGVAAATESGTLKAGAFDPPHPAPDFSLLGSTGSEVTLSRYRGKVVLLTFGFTSCAAVCPTSLATLAQARAGLGHSGDSVQVIFVTVDPERDSASQMRDYLAEFDTTFIGATGDPETLAAVRASYGVTATKQGKGYNYAMAHTSSIFLIDRAGKLRAMMPFGRGSADFVHDINLLLAR